MVLLSTKFAVLPDFTSEVLVSLLTKWIKESSHYDLDVQYEGQDEYELCAEDETSWLKIYRTDDKFAVEFSHKDDLSLYTNTYILSTSIPDKPLIFVRLTRELLKPVSRDKSVLRIPKLMRMIFWEEFGGMDNNILTDDKSLIIRRSNVDVAKGIVEKSAEYVNPVVYVSPYLENGKYATNYEKLASDLLGIAHVVVEGSPFISTMIHQATEGANPQNGEIIVFLPTGEFQSFAPNSTDLTSKVIQYVRDTMAVVTPGEEFSFQKIRYDYLLRKATEACGGNEELERLWDEMLTEKDGELASLHWELDAAKQSLYDVNMKYKALLDSLQHCDEPEKECSVQLCSTEKELYPNEMKDVILRVLEKEYKMISSDSAAGNSRKAHVLKNVLNNNEQSGMDDKLHGIFKKVFKDGTVDKKYLTELERLGFQVAMNGNRHYKIAFNGDSRYQISVATTPSDHRAGENLTSTYMNMLFGY